MKPQALAFDLDGTLWSCDDVIKRAEGALYAWLKRHHPLITEAYDREAMRVVRRDLARRHPELAADVTALRRASLEWHAREAGYDPGLAETGLAVFLAERHQVTPYADARPALERLAGAFPLVALTNGNADVRQTELGDLFHHFLTAADVGAAKPDPALFHAACRDMGVQPWDMVHIGDDPVRDIHAAHHFGARTVWINREGGEWPADVRRAHHEIVSLAELPEALGLEAGDGGAR
ncbi:HAD family hydrolase [Thiohalorhabdus sp.]|uniref:HAD family hydrolase n=1 Tax=Thiohalorhabdus sp. TaxID=3094134 RepID=UPI002FC293B1